MRTHNQINNDDSDDNDTDAFKVYHTATSQTHDVYLSDHVSADGSEYIDLYRFLGNAKVSDRVNIHIANFGGACHSGLRLAHAIRNCAAVTVVYVDAPCYSMGAILALCGDGLCMYPGTFLMFHNYSTMESGKAGEVQAAISEYSRHFAYSLEYFCRPFLTKKEIKLLASDTDVYIHADDDDLNVRLKRQFPNMTVN